ncbi:hypothetical protein GGR50DRAFT_697141 [Xylaria sp. CBS 124048]|nr:hypothetical protein GGR50DRAFT_697141 [Xylaria sp. CBS 124048]
MGNDMQLRGPFPSRPAPWYSERVVGEFYPEEGGQVAESSEARRPPWTITKGLRELCQIPGDVFFVAAERNGKIVCLSTPFGSSQLDHERFFNKNAFIDEVKRIQSADTNQSFDDTKLSFSGEVVPSFSEGLRTPGRERRHYSAATDDTLAEEGLVRSRKRLRSGSSQHGIGSSSRENYPLGSPISSKRGIKVSDSDAIYAFYDQRLKCCQQTACKIIAKAWVKAVAPKKQSTNPYTRGDKTRPDWWPKTYCKLGTNLYLDMRHKEPDHLGKEERVYLLCHILRLMVEPRYNQHAAIRKVNLTLDTLEAVTFEALSSWFTDKDCPGNMAKKPIVRDIFRVARQEALYRDGGMGGFDEFRYILSARSLPNTDGNTEVVLHPKGGSDAGRGYDSDSEDDMSHGHRYTPASSPGSSVEPTGPAIIPPLHPNEHSEHSHYAPSNYTEVVPLRGPYYPHAGYEQLPSHRPGFAETPLMNNPAPPPPPYGTLWTSWPTWTS